MLYLAWRNLWRNTRRTLITVAALTFGVAVLVGLHGYREATFEQMIRGITTGLVGDLQIHGRGYQESPELSNVVHDPAQVEAVLTDKLGGARTERRVVGAGLAGVADNSAPAMVMGVQAGADGELRTVVEGKDLSPAARKGAVLGVGIAEQLGAKVGGELILVGQAADGSVANDRYTVVGLARTQSSDMDLRAVFLGLEDAQEFFGLGQGVHQIVVRLPNEGEDLAQPLSLLRGALDLATLEAMAWNEILPDIEKMLADKREGQGAINVVIFLIVALGVLNAVSMSTFERTREFGVMASLGTRPRRILGLVLTEALLQGALSVLLGVGLAAAILYGIGELDLSAFGGTDIGGVRMPDSVTLRLRSGGVISGAFTALFTVVVGSLIPAIRAARLRPAEAARFV